MLNSQPANRASQPDLSVASFQADVAARSVVDHYGHRLLGLPGTHLGSIKHPASRLESVAEWHYWWQAHYVDCLVDAGLRELETGNRLDGERHPSAGALASRLVRTIRLRNFLRYTNWFYDDMAWLALAVGRLDNLAKASRSGGRERNQQATNALRRTLESAHTGQLGGGIFWNTKRDFKNTPATAPAALFFARQGQRKRAQELIDWLNDSLLDGQRGLYLDGLKIRGTETVLEPAIYSYNQGPVLGALLELGGAENLDRAAALVNAVEQHLSVDGVLLTHGHGDGGLFTGILVRYLAVAANDHRLPEEVRGAAIRMVQGTADALWEGRRERTIRKGLLGRRRTVTIFSSAPEKPAEEIYPPEAAVELSTQLQSWMTLEAAANLQ